MIKLATALGGGPGGDGVLQQTIVISEQALVRLPTGISTEFGSTLPCAALTAWSAVVVHGGVGPGSVVVTQGTGGVSLFALQFAKMLGTRVVATTSSEAKAAKLAELGADAIIKYRDRPDWTQRAESRRCRRSDRRGRRGGNAGCVAAPDPARRNDRVDRHPVGSSQWRRCICRSRSCARCACKG